MPIHSFIRRAVLLGLPLLAALPAAAQQVISDTLNGPASAYDWQAFNGACLTAGDGRPSSIPACVGLRYYGGSEQVGGYLGRLGAKSGAAKPDPAGKGALRLTNNVGSQNGGVVSKFAFRSNAGLDVLFTTVTYGGNAAGTAKNGADGMSFFLQDGSRPQGIGSIGGALGYACSNSNSAPDGLEGGYLGIGIDEFGNFANRINITNTGLVGLQPGLVSIRGAGDINYRSLNRDWPSIYLSRFLSLMRADLVRSACSKAAVHNWDGPPEVFLPPERTYRMLGNTKLPDGVQIANQQLVDRPLRENATPLTFKISISQTGIADVMFRVNGGTPQPLLSNFDIRKGNGPMPETFHFGFAASTGGGTNVHEITCFRAAEARKSQGSAAANAQQGAKVKAGAQVFIGSFLENNWWGDVQALGLLTRADGSIEVASSPTWSAHCALTGGPCEPLGSEAGVEAITPAKRRLLTWSGTRGVLFTWDRLTPALQDALEAGDPGNGPARLAYLRGERSQEISAGGPFRTRNSVLGDVINSSPAWVGPPRAPYPDVWVDRLQAGVAQRELGYSGFRTEKAERPGVVYAGANDGFLHGFQAGVGRYDAEGNFTLTDNSTNNGREVLGFMPWRALRTLQVGQDNLDYTSARYAHNAFVDATPGSGDLFYGGSWHTWLAGGLGFGGNPAGVSNEPDAVNPGALYVLDVTDPGSFSEDNAAALVVANLDSDTLACTGAPGCAKAFGSQTGTPVIGRLHNGQWAVLFGNGLNSASGTAGMFIGLVDPVSGKIRDIRFLDTGAGPSVSADGKSVRNGIAYVALADLDGDKITDYAYGGDVLGNLWRFDLTSANPAEWSARAVFEAGLGQPITTRPIVALVPPEGAERSAGRDRVIVSFGTGQAWPQTMTSGARFAAGAQALYGIWDWRMEDWNSKAGPGAQYASLAGPVDPRLSSATLSPPKRAPGPLGAEYQTLASAKVCWAGSSACASGNMHTGWKVAMVNADEQFIFNPTLFRGQLFVNTVIPPQEDRFSCEASVPSGFTLAVDIATGGAPAVPPFNIDSLSASSLRLGATGTPLLLVGSGTASKVTMILQRDGKPITKEARLPNGANGQRLNWLKVR